MYKGIKIHPMTEFWIDCYSTAIFSILLSRCSINRSYIYNNNYIYKYDRNERKDLGRVYVKMDVDKLVSNLLINKEKHNFAQDENIISNLKNYIDKSKIILLGIDMFYGISNTSQWHKHHIRHYILVEGYDDTKKCMYILETGEEGYQEYTFSYEDISTAAKNFTGESYIYDVNSKFEAQMYDVSQLKKNAEKIILSIDSILVHIDKIWHVKEENMLSMKDEIETHLKSIMNRQKVNKVLFEKAFVSYDVFEYVKGFATLEMEYKFIREFFIQSIDNNVYYQYEKNIKNKFSELLFTEKLLWKHFSKSKIDLLYINV